MTNVKAVDSAADKKDADAFTKALAPSAPRAAGATASTSRSNPTHRSLRRAAGVSAALFAFDHAKSTDRRILELVR